MARSSSRRSSANTVYRGRMCFVYTQHLPLVSHQVVAEVVSLMGNHRTETNAKDRSIKPTQPPGQAAMQDALKKPSRYQGLMYKIQHSVQNSMQGVKPLKPNKNVSIIFNPWHNHAEKQRKNLRKEKASHTGSICLAQKCLQDHCSKCNHMNLLFCRTYKALHTSMS